jgi:hypothetical protein
MINARAFGKAEKRHPMPQAILFATTSMLAVTVTFEKKHRSFEHMLLAFCGLLFWLSLHNIRKRWIA